MTLKTLKWIVPAVAALGCFTDLTAGGQEAERERTAADGPFLPAAVMKGGMVLPLYAPDSARLKRERIHEAERYNTTNAKADRLMTTLNIHNPSMEVLRAGDQGPNTGAAIIVAPGGGHKILWLGPEGYDLAPFLSEHGVATIVLRNRLRVDGYEPTTDAVSDAFQAVRLVRAHAAEWGIDPAKIGLLGFSAGAELAAPAALFFENFARENAGPGDPLANISPRPDFVGLIYPGPTPFARGGSPVIPPHVPPSFLVCAGSGDKVHALWATEYFTPMLAAGVPNLEMHIYGHGGHGGAISERGGIPFGTWQVRFLEWLDDLGFLGAPGVETKAARDTAAYAGKQGGGR